MGMDLEETMLLLFVGYLSKYTYCILLACFVSLSVRCPVPPSIGVWSVNGYAQNDQIYVLERCCA